MARSLTTLILLRFESKYELISGKKSLTDLALQIDRNHCRLAHERFQVLRLEVPSAWNGRGFLGAFEEISYL